MCPQNNSNLWNINIKAEDTTRRYYLYYNDSPIVSHLKILEFVFYGNTIFAGGKSLCQKIEKSRKLSANVAKTEENRKEKGLVIINSFFSFMFNPFSIFQP